MQVTKLIALSILIFIEAGYGSQSSAIAADEPSADEVAFYKAKVLPLLAHNCIKCHGGKPKIKGGLNLTAHEGLLQGGDTGPAIDLANPAKSLLLEAVSYSNEDMEMPPKGKLADSDIAILKKWIEMGAPMPADAQKLGSKPAHKGTPQVNAETRNHWSFKAVADQPLPAVKNKAWVKQPFDAFILAKLESAGLAPSSAVNKAALIRRVTYDLTGLPPTPKAVAEFVKDASPDAYERLIDELLASPHYGEKWGRHWLDLVHYSETNSFERDNPKPDVWRYRDYVIQSFNSDKPYSDFIREQLAGDELESVTPDSVIATGYYRLGLWDDEPADGPQTRFDEMDDWLKVTSESFLALTIGCARCHDHKLDPVPQSDYYSMLAFFRDIRSFQNGNDGLGRRFATGNWHRKLSDYIPADKIKQASKGIFVDDTKYKQIESDLKRMIEAFRKKLPGGVRDDFVHESNQLAVLKTHGKLLDKGRVNHFRRLFNERAEIRKRMAVRDVKVLAASAVTNPAQTHVMIRGNPTAKGKPVDPAFPLIITDKKPLIPALKPGQKSAGRRLVLANWIASEKNPLTARVAVNRVWQHLFGRGIVRSPSDFGLAGIAPTHPKLLDYLAADFVKGGWRFKQLQKKLLMSSTYQMAAEYNSAAFLKDPMNNLFWRFNMRRLTAEEIRDSILVTNGRFNAKMFGPSIYTVIPREVLHSQSRPGAGWRPSNEQERGRRSIYIHQKRSLVEPFLEQFDLADMDNTCPVRFVTIQPTQALGMFNSEFVHQQADVFAKRVEKDAGTDVAKQVRRAMSLATQREPTSKEVVRGVKLIGALRATEKLSDHDALKYFCLVTLNLNEFFYLD